MQVSITRKLQRVEKLLLSVGLRSLIESSELDSVSELSGLDL